MTARPSGLPLGIDIGSARVRVARVVAQDGRPVLQSTLAVDLPPAADVSRVLRGLLDEAGVAERRCVVALDDPDATLVRLVLPPMPSHERRRAARFEAARIIRYPLDEAQIRLQPVDAARGVYVMGIARQRALRARTDLLRRAGLVPTAIDQASLALLRALPSADAVLDVGVTSSHLHVFGGDIPVSVELAVAGATFTHAIVRSLAIDEDRAEAHKRAHGSGGAADPELRAFGEAVGAALIEARSRALREIAHLTLVGNGALLPGLVPTLEQRTGCVVVPATNRGIPAAYPDDVLRSTAMDRALACGLALWPWSGKDA